MPLLQWGEWKPDVSDYEGSAAYSILNVIPRGDGYGPFRGFAGLSQALPSGCRGGIYVLKSDGSVAIFAGTDKRLYLASNTDYSWIPVSKVISCTITSASPGVITEVAHDSLPNEPKVFSNSGGALPVAITAGTVYYLKTVLSVDTYTISATPGGAAINTASTGTGTHSVTHLYSALSSDAQWQFAPFGSLVKATQKNAVLQTYTLGSSSAFADNAGSPPQASYISVVGRFLVLSGLLSNPFRIQWSGLNDTTQWTSGVGSSDFQDFPDGGIVRGVAGGEAGIVFQDQAIRRMSYIPGSPLIFQIDRIAQDKGLFGPYSIIRAGELVFFHSAHGLYKIAPGGLPEQIGREKADRTFFDELDKTELRMLIGASDPRGTRAFWAYKSTAGITGLYDKILGYDYALDRFFKLSISGEYLLGMSQPGITLEGLDAISSSLDALGASLDSFAVSTQPLISQFSSEHKLGFFQGSNLEATLESAEQGTDEQRVTLCGFRPITDSATVYGRVTYRDTQAATSTPGSEVLMSSRTGRCDMMRDARYIRYKARIPAATTWSYCAGVVPDVTTNGTL